MMRIVEISPHADLFRQHLQKIVESSAFRTSRRSQYFLQFVVNRALDGSFEVLKERSLGVELFGRDPSYDTDKDAIVRVTACEVRRRLSQYYTSAGEFAELRIDVPPGSYIPEFRSSIDPSAPVEEPPAEGPVAAVPVETAPAVAPIEILARPTRTRLPLRMNWMWVLVAVVSLAALLTVRALTWGRSAEELPPWSAIIQAGRKAHLIYCDPDIVTVQMLMRTTISLSDYAGKNYFPKLESLDPETRRVLQAFQGTNIAAVDSAIGIRISNLLAPASRDLLVMHPARRVALTDFKTDDNFVLLGSPRSNPWVALFKDQMGFQFDSAHWRTEQILNTRPGPGEPAAYVPTAAGWGTGQAYAIVSLVNNPGQRGHVLILAGTSAESTEAAGAFVTNSALFGDALKRYGIARSSNPEPFEILLRVATMAGSSTTFEVVACHKLSNPPTGDSQ